MYVYSIKVMHPITIIILFALLIAMPVWSDIPAVESPNQGIVPPTFHPTVDLYKPDPYCAKCVVSPTPTPVPYKRVNITFDQPTKTTIRRGSYLTLTAHQVSGQSVSDSARWDWIIGQPIGQAYSRAGTTIQVPATSFGKWRINVNVVDYDRKLEGHYSGNVFLEEKR